MVRFLVVAALALCACNSEYLRAEPPTQSPLQNPLAARGQKSFEQRQRDCWDMPSAQACYDVALNFELGLAVVPDAAKARQYYDKACALEKQAEHCEAAERMRK